MVHNAIPHEKSFIDRAFAKYFFRQCDGFITLSESVKSDVQQFVPNAKIMLYPHPVYDHYKDRFDKVTACEKLNVSADKNNILFFGLIREYKGLDLLIEATNFLNEDYQLIIAGESYEDFKKYQDLIDASPLKNNIKVFAQYIPDNMVTTLFSASDLLVLPYRSATQSGVVTVAYQLELPMVATDVGGLGSTIRSANTGIVTKDITPQGIANAILDFFNSNEKNIFIENIRKEKDRLSWKSFVSNLDKFLNKDIL
ncbi:MAG: glycosyltransferase family 4 protein [Dysgonomonas sp.]